MDNPIRFNPFSPSFRADPYPTYAALRASDPVHRVFGTWVLTRYEDNVAVLRDRRFASTAIPDMIKRYKAKAGRDNLDLIDRFIEKTVVFTENPDHARLRRLMSDAFSSAAIARESPRLDEIVRRRFDALRAHDVIEVVSDIADPIPLEVTCARLGVPPSMRETVARWTHQIRFLLDPGMMRPSDYETVHDVMGDFYESLRGLLDQRRREPGGDVFSLLLAARSGDDRLTDDEIIALGIVSFVAGHETTRYLIANAIRLLLEHPGELEKLRRAPELVSSAVDEVLRYDAPLQQTKRVATANVEIGGQRIAKGEHLLLCFGAGNRDPERFADPDRFDVSRGDKAHLGFGHGMRGCLGGALAHSETQAVLHRFLELGDVRPVDDAIAWQEHSLILRGPSRYRVRRSALS